MSMAINGKDTSQKYRLAANTTAICKVSDVVACEVNSAHCLF